MIFVHSRQSTCLCDSYANDIERFIKEQKFFAEAEESASSRADDSHTKVSEKTISHSSSSSSSQNKRKADDADGAAYPPAV